MVLLQHIQSSHSFKEVKWEVEGELVFTERGLRRIVKWPHKDLAMWHLQWRDQLYERTKCLTDRMLQTVHGERVQLFADGWITLHDEVTSLFSYQASEKEIGRFLGLYYSNETKIDSMFIAIDEYSMNTFQKELLTKPEYVEDENFDELVDSLRKESLIRYWKAEKLFEDQKENSFPIVCPIRSLDQGRMINGVFFWQHPQGNPEKGYRSLKLFLSQWLQRFGEGSLFLLLTEMEKYFSLKENHGIFLSIECLLPWEMIDYLKQIKDARSEEEKAIWKERLTYQWENNRALLKALNKWLQVTEKKVFV